MASTSIETKAATVGVELQYNHLVERLKFAEMWARSLKMTTGRVAERRQIVNAAIDRNKKRPIGVELQ